MTRRVGKIGKKGEGKKKKKTTREDLGLVFYQT